MREMEAFWLNVDRPAKCNVLHAAGCRHAPSHATEAPEQETQPWSACDRSFTTPITVALPWNRASGGGRRGPRVPHALRSGRCPISDWSRAPASRGIFVC